MSQRAYKQSSGLRRVLAMSVMLALVVMLMMRMSDRQSYEPAFRSIGLTSSQIVDPPPIHIDHDHVDEKKSAITATPSLPDFAIWNSILQSLTKEQLLQLTTAIFGFNSNASNSSITSNSSSPNNATASSERPSWIDAVNNVLTTWDVSASDVEGSRDENYDAFKNRWRQFQVAHPNADFALSSISIAGNASDTILSSHFQLALQAAVDHRLLKNVVDAATWRSNESITFARTLQRASNAKGILHQESTAIQSIVTQLPNVDIPLLTRQMDSMRGQLVRIQGYVKRADRSPVTKRSRLGEMFYHVLWIKPTTINSIPFCVYLVAQNDVDANPLVESDDQIIEFAALPLKRLAYASQSGLQVAPVLVGVNFRLLPESEVTSSLEPDHKLMHRMDQNDPLLFRHRYGSIVDSTWQSPPQRLAHKEIVTTLISQPLTNLVRDRAEFEAALCTKELAALDKQVEATRINLAQLCSGIRRVNDALPSGIISDETLAGADFGTWQVVVTGVQKILLPSQLSQGLGQTEMYRLKIHSEVETAQADGEEGFAFVLAIPGEWRLLLEQDDSIFQFAELRGLRVKNDSAVNEKKWLFSDRVQWKLPVEISPKLEELKPPISSQLRGLATGGWDLGLLDQVRERQKLGIDQRETDAFYTFIEATMKSVNDSQSEAKGVVDCLRDPKLNCGFLVASDVQCVKITRIRVENSEHQKLLGGSQYFEINALADIGSQSIRVVAKPGDEPLVFSGEFPVTMIAREIPSSLLPIENSQPNATDDGQSESWYLSKPLHLTGRFYRLWAFETAQTALNPLSNNRQVAPLIMVQELVALVGSSDTTSHWIINTTFALILMMVAVAWLLARIIDYRSKQRKNAQSR